ncbi:MAG: YdeI/OmpD-associated family protein [Bacteroidota bacterium]
MGKKDKRIDAYIAKARPFAQPILKKLRALIHKGNPGVEETIKWGMPSFEYKGPFCSFASFSQHAVFGFWKYKLIKDPKGYLQEIRNKGGDAMGNLGRITDISDLPPDKVIIDFVKQAKKLNDEGIKVPARPQKPKAELVIPEYFMRALRSNKKALAVWEKASYSFKKEYLMWITEAKTEATREKRIETMLEWMAEGKGRNWKYERK